MNAVSHAQPPLYCIFFFFNYLAFVSVRYIYLYFPVLEISFLACELLISQIQMVKMILKSEIRTGVI